MQSQTIGFYANATMGGFENAILHSSENETTNQDHDALEPTDNQGTNSENLTSVRNDTTVSPPTQNDPNENGEVGDEPIEKCDLSSFWPPKKDEFVVALLEDGVFIGSVEDVGTNKLYLNYLKPKSPPDRQLWVWSDEPTDWIDRSCIMEIYPSLSINRNLSTRRMIVYELMNLEIINAMLEFC